MIVDPVHENDYYDAYKSLEHKKNQYLAHHHFRFSHSPKERIDAAQKKHAFLDLSPTKMHTGKFPEQLLDLRPRIVEKEIGPAKFRHKPITRIEQVYDALAGRTSSNIGPNEIIDPKHAKRARGQSTMATMQPSPLNLSINLDVDLSRQSSTRKNATGQPSPKMLPDIVGPKQIVPKLHNKTHFKAATSVFLNHSGTLNHKDA